MYFGIITFRNIGPHPCSLRAYPGMLRHRRDGQVIATQVERVTQSVATIIVDRGQQASSAYAVRNGATTECPVDATLDITPPDETTFVSVRAQMPACDALVRVSSLHAGKLGPAQAINAP